MGQPLRNSQARPPAYWQTIRDRIESGKAVKVINQALNGDVLPAQLLYSALQRLKHRLHMKKPIHLLIHWRGVHPRLSTGDPLYISTS